MTHVDLSNTGPILSACGKEPDGKDYFVTIYHEDISKVVTCEECLHAVKYLIKNEKTESKES